MINSGSRAPDKGKRKESGTEMSFVRIRFRRPTSAQLQQSGRLLKVADKGNFVSLIRSYLELKKRTKSPLNHCVLLDNPKTIERLGLLSQPLFVYFSNSRFSLRLVTQTDAFEDLIHPFGVVGWIEDFVDFFLTEA